MMSNTKFGSRLAHCNVGPWGRTRDDAVAKCNLLLDDPALSPEQHASVLERLKTLTKQSIPLPHNPHVASGFYHITPHSKLALFRNAIDFSSDEFHTMYEFMEHDVDSSPNPRNPSTFLKRKQCTFVTPGTSGYEFGQENQTFRMEVDTWPLAVRRALDKAKQLSNDFFGDTCGTYNGVHANLYRDGSVGVNPHADKEISMLTGAPIFSFTLLSDPSLPRPFSIYTQKNEKLYDISLGHGDILVMYGKMQQEFKHGIEAAKPPKMYKSLRRINMTVRAFLPQ